MAEAKSTEALYGRLLELLKEERLLRGVGSLLGWDQETQMPKKAAPLRAEQHALLSGIQHERFVTDELGEVLGELEARGGELGPEQRANVRETRRSYDRRRKLPKRFVSELARATSEAHEAWVEARRRSEFGLFAPHLERIIALKLEEAELVGYAGEPYDALLDEYEPGGTAEAVAPVLGALREGLVPLVQAIAERPSPEPVRGPFAEEDQRRFALLVAEAMGFDFDAGRLDVAPHPFCSGFEPNDVRLTTRYDQDDLRQALFGVIHEAGHGQYEQGLLADHYGTPMGEACSCGIHESQSRLWENVVGRSRPFWEHFFPILREHFPGPLAGVDVERWHRWVNDVRCSLIRVEADEVTYNLHILLRFEIERALLKGEVAVAELPGAWNEKVERYLGLVPPSDAEGVLQDIHWSMGAFGYFPSYSLGNLYAAQIFASAERALPGLWDAIARGELLGLKRYLNEQVHARGMLYRPDELVEVISGEPLSAGHFTAYLSRKFGSLYGLS